MTLKRVTIGVGAVVLSAGALSACGGQTTVSSSPETGWGVAVTASAAVPGVSDAVSQRLCAPDNKVVLVTRSLSAYSYHPAYPTWTGDKCDFAKASADPAAHLPNDPGFGVPITQPENAAGVANATSQKFCGPDGKVIVVTRSSQAYSYKPAYPAWTGDRCPKGAGLGH